MNGFLLNTKGRYFKNTNPERVVPVSEDSTYEFRKFGTGEYLLTWGHACGDIWFAEQADKAFLVLSGYIAEFESGPEFKSQEEVARYLLSQFVAAKSYTELEYLLNRVYGSFGIVFRDQVQDITICVTDRVSSRPIWRSWQQAEWIISSHVTTISLSVTMPKFDSSGLGAFLLYGGPIEPTRSIYKGIYGTPSGSIVKHDSKGEHDVRRWYRFRHCEDNDLSVSEWSRLVADRLVHAADRVARHTRRPAVFFSGGTDSRLTASALKSSGNNPIMVTLCDGKNIEVRVSQMASKALGLEQTLIVRDRHWYLRGLPNSVYESGGNYVWTHGHFSSAAAKVQKEHGADVFLLGDFCEAFSKICCSLDSDKINIWNADTFNRMFDLIRLPLYRPNDREATLSLFNATARNEIKDALRSDIEHRFKEMSALANDPFIIGDLCFRWESVNSMPTFFMFLDLRSMVAERNLMFDRDVHQLLENLPSNMRDGNNLGACVINHLQPKAAWVVNSNSLLPMIWPQNVHNMSKRIKPILGSMRRFLISNTYRTTGSWPENSKLYASDPQWRQYFERIFAEGDLFDPEIFNIDAIRGCWESLADGNAGRANDIEKLVHLALSTKLLRDGALNFFRDTLVSSE